jgi:hypothetical protein
MGCLGIEEGGFQAIAPAASGPRLRARDWQKNQRWIFLAAGVYGVATLAAQLTAGVPAAREASAVEVSTNVVASLGLAFAALQMFRNWTHPLTRAPWMVCVAGMLLIWLSEIPVDGLNGENLRLTVLLWAVAAILLFRGMQCYAIHASIAKLMWFGAAAQALAHGTWLLSGSAATTSPAQDVLIDTGELAALLSYIVSFALARSSSIDDHVAGGRKRLALGRARVCFPYIAQKHQMLHSLPIALALAQRHPGVEVHVAGSAQHLEFVREIAARRPGFASLSLVRLYLAWPLRLLARLGISSFKKLTLAANRHYLSSFDAVVVPERTSTRLRKLSPQVRLIGTEHGAGDRDATFVPEIALYDFLLLPGEKQALRLTELGYTQPGKYVTGVYAKLDWTSAADPPPRRLFANGRPTVLYNPHFDPAHSSWHLVGRDLLELFYASGRYNLIFAPHVRLFDPLRCGDYRAFSKYLNCDHMIIDLGSDRCVDMTYTREADIYLGDVSSQVVEYLIRPRPCVFLNPRGIAWQGDLHYRFWNLGPVVESLQDLEPALAQAAHFPPRIRELQEDYVRCSLGEIAPGLAGPRGADAIVAYLSAQAV